MRALLAAAVLLACASGALAQTFVGGVRGKVEGSGGVLQGAAVELTDQDTRLSRVSATNARGEFAFTNVRPGRYVLRVAVAGYKTFERPALRIGTQAFVTVDVALEIGSISERVIVEGVAPLIEPRVAGISTLLTRESLDRLPSAGRNIFYTAGMTQTVVPSGDSRFVRQQDQSNSSFISMGGGARRNNSYVVDGVPVSDLLNRATLIPSFHAIDEMRVQISAYDAEIGRTSGGVFNVIGRSGTNQWRGSALYQQRPGWGQSDPFFAKKNNIRSDARTYYHLYGGGIGGPIVRNRTFVYVSTEGYRSLTTRSAVMILPTEAERRGDFSRSAQIIYDPLTTRPDPHRAGQFLRDPFPGNRIPLARLNPVAAALTAYLPLPTSGNSRPAVANLVDAADQLTAKLTQRWTDRLTSTGLVAWYGSSEPDPRFLGGGEFDNPADPGGGSFVRRAPLLATTTTWTPGSRTVVEARAGFNHLLDDNRPSAFDPSGLGFDAGFLASVPQPKFPGIGVSDYSTGYGFLGDRFQATATYYGRSISASVSSLRGRHSVKAGAEYRRTGVRFINSGGTGSFSFDRGFTFGPDPNRPGGNTGDGFASFLLGYPATGGIFVGTPLDLSLSYWAGFAQDEVRIGSRLTLNLGLRYEFETGVSERADRLTTGWADDALFPVQVNATRPDGAPLVLRGGLRYAGQDGAARGQGSANPWQFAPRAGATFALGPRAVLRGGYGLFWAPPQGITADEFGSATLGYNQSTGYVATGANPFVPCDTCSLTNPFPAGIQQPSGNSHGRLTGVGGTVSFVDPESRMAHFHRYSIDLQRQVGDHLALTVGYMGAAGRDLVGGVPLGGLRNINQLDTRYFSLGTALQEAVPNPFFGTSLGTGILAGTTIARGQLLRPYPQFDGVYVMRSNLARSRYDALLVSGTRRLANGWSAQANYTWSRQRDSQFNESNFFAGGSSGLDSYNVDAEYGTSVLDTPHRLNVNATYELRGWLIGVVGSLQSGFPVTLQQSPNNSHLLGSSQRPNVVAGVNPLLTGDPRDSFDPSCGCIRWLNPAAWSQAAPFTFGNAPRADGRARTPARRNWDLLVERSQRIAGTVIGLRLEVINVLNAVDFRGPNIAHGDPTFGQIRDAGGFPRMAQLSARLAW